MKSGFIAILGRPNVGKSTLVNRLVGAKVAIVSPKAQTTREAIQGIVNRPEGQIVFVDSPGIHEPRLELGRHMLREVDRAADGCHAVMLVVDASTPADPREAQAIERARAVQTPIVLCLNKVDLVRDKNRLLPLIESYRGAHEFAAYVPISARSGEGVDDLIETLFGLLPEGPAYYPEDYVTDQPERFLAAELIRERILLESQQEVPHSTAVVIEEWKDEPRLLRLAAVIYVERSGQKAILLGAKGERMKRIATAARLALEDRFGRKVFLQIFIKVKAHWRDRAPFLRSLELRRQASHAGDDEKLLAELQASLDDASAPDPLP